MEVPRENDSAVMSNNSDSDVLDINDAFESIVFSEDKLANLGFSEGLENGKRIGEFEGYHLGYHQGILLGAEIGFYKGLVEALSLNTSQETTCSEINSVLLKLRKLLDNFPKSNDEKVDIILLRDDIRSTYKRLCSMLKLDPKIFDKTLNNKLQF